MTIDRCEENDLSQAVANVSSVFWFTGTGELEVEESSKQLV